MNPHANPGGLYSNLEVPDRDLGVLYSNLVALDEGLVVPEGNLGKPLANIGESF